jgi:DNA polymerase bacteriophage-type
VPSITWDCETRSVADLRLTGTYRYAADSSTSVLCIAYAVDNDPVKLWVPGDPVPPEFVEASHDPTWISYSFNDLFERVIAEAILVPKHGWPRIPIERRRCLMAMSLALALPGSLAGVAKALGLTHQKDSAGGRLMLQMSKPRRPRRGEDPSTIHWWNDDERVARLQAYCVADVETERELMQRLRPLAPREQRLWQLDAQINHRGIQVDRRLVKKAAAIVDRALVDLDVELAELTGGKVEKASQVARLAQWAASRGAVLKSCEKGAIEKKLAGKVPGDVRRALTIRLESAHASTKKLGAILSHVGDDNRIRGTLQYHGAAPGRWVGRGPQVQNLKRVNGVDIDTALAAIETGDVNVVRQKFGPPLELIGQMLRPMVVARRRHRFIGGDFSQIESRVLAWLSGEAGKLASFCEFDAGRGPDIYVTTYARAFGIQPAAVTEQQRQVGKVMELALGFAGGIGAFQNMAANYGVEISDQAADVLKRRWRAAHPRTVTFWHRLNKAAIAAVWTPGKVTTAGKIQFRRDGGYLFCRLPSSRRISYPFPRLIEGKFGDWSLSFKDNAGGKWVDCRFGHGTYGGAIAENVTQAVARDILAEALWRLERAGYPVTLHVHDEVVCELPIGSGSTEEFKAIVETLPRWAEGLPVAAEPWEGFRYSK